MPTVAIAYPAELPCPTAAPGQWVERRALSSLPGPRQSVVMSRDQYAAPQPVSFILRTNAQVQRWLDWGRDDLEDWGHWFACEWPQPQGGVSVRRFVGVPSYPRYVPRRGGWFVQAQCEIRGRGELPVAFVPPLLGLHFDAAFPDTSGHTIAPFDYTFGSTVPAISGTHPAIGSGNVVFTPFSQPLISDNRGSLKLNEFGEWQIRFWIRPTMGALGYAGSSIFALMHGGASGDALNGNAGSGQIFVQTVAGGVGYVLLRVDYCADIVGVRSRTLQNVGSAVHVPLDEWTFVAIVGDETSTRAYIGGTLAQDDHLSAQPAGSAPMFVTDNFTDQFFVVGGAYVGGGSPAFPVGTTWFQLFSGEVDDLCVSNGPDSVEFTGSTIAVPSGPFR